MLWQRGDELLSVLPLDQETRKWRQTEDTEFDCVKSRFAKAGEVPACPPIAAELRRGDRVLHYEYWELDAVRRLGPLYESAQQPREFTRLLELQRAALMMEGRSGLVLLREWQSVLRVCTDAALEEEPFSRAARILNCACWLSRYPSSPLNRHHLSMPSCSDSRHLPLSVPE